VIEVKLRGGQDLDRMQAAATKAAAAVESARARLTALRKAQKIGPPTEIEAAAEAAGELADEAKRAAAGVRHAAKEEREWGQAIAKANREIAERAKGLEAVRARLAKIPHEVDASNKRIDELTAGIGRAREALRSAPGRFFAGIREDARSALAEVFSVRGAIAGVKSAGRGALRAGAVGVGAGLAGAAAAGVGALGEIVGRGSEFAAQRDTLANRLGSRSAAEERIAELRGIKGLSTGSGVAAVNRLEGLGLDSSARSVKALASIGANTPGKGIADAAEALADAGTGEFERLKELGFGSPSAAGDKVKVTFRGVTEEIDKGAAAFQSYFTRIAETKLGDTLDLRANTLAGAVEHLQDKITQAASAVYDSGLGDALREIVSEVSAMFDATSGPGAERMGRVLGDALRGLWERAKELIGPVEELPGKIGGAIETAIGLAEALAKLASWAASVASALGPTGLALGAFAVAATAAAGPVGAVVAGGVALGTVFGTVAIEAHKAAQSILDASSGLDKFRESQEKIEAMDRATIATRQAEEETNLIRKQNKRSAGSDEASDATAAKFRAARLRRLGKSEAGLTDAERRDLDNRTATVRARARAAGRISDAGEGDSARAGGDLIAAEESGADAAEISRLRAKRANKALTPAEAKRIGELEKKYNLAKPKSAGKPERSELENKIEAEIKQRAQAAGEVAGLRALKDGSGRKEASALALRTEKETTERLRGQVDQGRLLPGQINANVLALARVEDVASRGTPPPIAVTNVGPVTVTVPVEVTGNTINADARQIGLEVRRVVKGVMVEETRDALRLIASGVKG